jgi:hypothetical protein
MSQKITAIFGGASPDMTTVLKATSAMTLVTDYLQAPLANTGAAVTATQRTPATNTDPAVYESSVTLSPLVSRLELVSVKGGTDDEDGVITGFDVTGVYVDDYYSDFDYTGFGAGTRKQQGQSTTFTGIGDGDDFSATNVSGVWTANPTAGKVWAYNVAPSPAFTSPVKPVTPRLLIELKNVKHTPDGGTEQTLTNATGGTFYLTVTGYNSDSDFAFKRGKIYRIGTASNPFVFDKDDLGLTPNPTNVNMFVEVEIQEWILDLPTANL